MSPPTDRFFTAATVRPFPAGRTTVERHRPAWLIGLLVLAGTTVAGLLLGPVVAVLAFELAPLNPLTLALGATVGALYGGAVGVLTGSVSAVAVAVARAARATG